MIPYTPNEPEQSGSFATRGWLRLGWALPWLVLAVTLGVTYLVWQSERQNALKDLRTDFDFRAREANARIDQRIKAYEQILRGVRGLLQTSGKVTAKEFHEYVELLHLADNYPGTRSIGYARLEPVTVKTTQGKDSARTSVVYLEKLSGGDKLRFPVGTDMYADPMRRLAMEQARDAGAAVISGKLELPRATYEDKLMQGGFLMFLPVYSGGDRHDTLAGRRASLGGWVYASFHMVDLMQDILWDISDEVDIEIHDGDIVSDDTMMYDPDISGTGGSPDALFKSRSLLKVGGHHWTVIIRSLYGFEKRLDSKKSDFIAYVGGGTSLLLALMTWLLVKGQVRALRSASELSRELTERKRAEERLKLAATVVRTVEEAVIVTDANNLILAVNPAFTEITGYREEEVVGRNPRILSSGRHSREFFSQFWETLLATGSWHGEIWDKRKSGEIYVKWLSIRLVRNEHGKVTHHVGVFSDISERKAAEDKLQRLAHYDALTDLPNRALFNDRLQRALAQAKRERARLALMFLDLDKFKPINDTFGHAVGDLLLKEVAKRLRNCIRESDTVSRIGGDEFVVLLPVVEGEQDSTRVAEKMLHALDLPFELAGQILHISCSIGVAVYPDHGADERSLTRSADIAMYLAKSGGRNNVKLYRQDMSVTGAYCAFDPASFKPEPPQNHG